MSAPALLSVVVNALRQRSEAAERALRPGLTPALVQRANVARATYLAARYADQGDTFGARDWAMIAARSARGMVTP